MTARGANLKVIKKKNSSSKKKRINYIKNRVVVVKSIYYPYRVLATRLRTANSKNIYTKQRNETSYQDVNRS